MRNALLLGILLVLCGCGGMNRAVGVLPAALDDLGRQSAPLRCGGIGEAACL
ncbi:MAG: hypothetical protein H7Y08_02325 [Rhizobiaceae bacterium]|nr:hypothetical protein [Rhizobiaceae bacterium]